MEGFKCGGGSHISVALIRTTDGVKGPWNKVSFYLLVAFPSANILPHCSFILIDVCEHIFVIFTA